MIMVRKHTKKKICGEFHGFCYKAFNNKKHAKDFINRGTFRMGCILSYREIEDESRRDVTEGEGNTKEHGILTVGLVSQNPAEKTIWTKKKGYKEYRTEYGNAIFCLCTCLPDVNLDYMKNRFGQYVVKINNPRKLAEDINEYFIGKGKNFLIVGCEVVYNKGKKLNRELTNNERLDLAYKQKPEKFTADCEFRIVAINLGDPCDHKCKYLDGQFKQVEPECKFVEVSLGKQLNYLSLLPE